MLLGGCLSGETAFMRQGSLGGPARGGVMFRATASTYYDTGTQAVSVGAELGGLAVGPADNEPLHATMAFAARYARQITDAPEWRAFVRGSFGGDWCRMKECTPEQTATIAPHSTVTLQIGAEHRLSEDKDESMRTENAISADLGIIYSRASDEMLGASDFIGVSLGLRIETNYASRMVKR